MLERLSEHSMSDLVVCGLKYLNESGKIIKTCESIEKITLLTSQFINGNLTEYINNKLLCGVYNKLYNAKIIRANNIKFDVNMKILEDGLFVFRYLKYANSVTFISGTHYLYYQNSGSLMSEYSENANYAVVQYGSGMLALFDSESSYNEQLKLAEDILSKKCLVYLEDIFAKSGQNNTYKWNQMCKYLHDSDFMRLAINGTIVPYSNGQKVIVDLFQNSHNPVNRLLLYFLLLIKHRKVGVRAK